MIDATIERCRDRGWTDGLPVVPPTRALVDRMLGERAERSEELVAVLEPAGGEATLGKVAANAVMAGCEPRHLAVLEVAVRAVADPAFNLDRVLTTASAQVPVLLVGGPAAQAAGIDGGTEVLGSTTRANAALGRALMLVLRNVGGLRAGGQPHATLGQPGARGLCFTENETLSPWAPCHADWGGELGASYVTVYPGEPPLSIVDMGRIDPELILRTIAESIAIPGSYNAFFREELWLVMSPQHATALSQAGWSRADAADFLFAHVRLPVDRLRDRGLHGYVDALVPNRSLVGREADEAIPLVAGAEHIRIVVAGGPFGGYSAAILGEGVSVTRRVDPQRVA